MPFTHDKVYGSSNLPAPSDGGHVAEWFNAPYLKYDVLRYHEFESHLVRINLIKQQSNITIREHKRF